MKKRNLVVILILATLFLSSIPLARTAAMLASPSVSLPNSDWEETDSVPYPESVSEHDPEGAGMLEYTDNTNYDRVEIYYEKALVASYTSSQLKVEAEGLFEEYDSSDTRMLDASGTATFAGVEAGYAEGYDETENTYITELVFIKGSYYFNVRAYYDATSQSEANVQALIDSIGVSEGSGDSSSSFPWLYVVVGVVIVVVVIILLLVMLSRKNKSRLQESPPYRYPPPPPADSPAQ